jgi:hypothetical protein
MQKPSSLNNLSLNNDILVAASRSRCHYIMLEGKWKEQDDAQQIHKCANQAHELWTSYSKSVFCI